MTLSFKATGTLEGIREATVMSETQGRIVSVPATNGRRVGTGASLAIVESELKAIALKQAEAARLTAEASKEKAELDLKRTKELFTQNASTKSQLEMAELGVKSAEAQLKAAESGESLARKQLSDASVRAPFAGIVAMKYINQGELLAPGVRVATLVDDSKMKMKINIGELDVPLVSVGDRVSIRIDALAKDFEGKISTISSKADMARTYMLEVEMPNPNHELKSGMFARAEIKRDAAREVPTVPAEAIITSGQRSQVFVAEGNVARLKAVKLGSSDRSKVEITDGVKAGDKVITFGQNQLKDGTKILVKN
jgi:multidrug efflux system membrane fusion protein